MSDTKEAAHKPLVCTLPSPEFAARRMEVHEFVDRASSVVPTPTGLQFVFRNTSDAMHALADFILFEQKCCNAVSYELQSVPPHTDLVLQLHASGELLASLRALYLGEREQNAAQVTDDQNATS